MPPASEVQKLLAQMGAVWRLAVHLCAVRHAETMVQETFARAFRDPEPSDARVELRVRLFKILHDVAREHDEREERELMAAAPSTAAGSTLPPTHARPAPGQLDAPTDSRTRTPGVVDALLQSAICELPLPQRAVFLLSVVEEMRYGDIALIVGASLEEVGVRLREAQDYIARRRPAVGGAASAETTETLPSTSAGESDRGTDERAHRVQGDEK